MDEDAIIQQELQVEKDLIDAILKDNFSEMKRIIKMIEDQGLVIGEGSSALTPLYVACERRNIRAVNFLLQHGQNINALVQIRSQHILCNVLLLLSSI